MKKTIILVSLVFLSFITFSQEYVSNESILNLTKLGLKYKNVFSTINKSLPDYDYKEIQQTDTTTKLSCWIFTKDSAIILKEQDFFFTDKDSLSYAYQYTLIGSSKEIKQLYKDIKKISKKFIKLDNNLYAMEICGIYSFIRLQYEKKYKTDYGNFKLFIYTIWFNNSINLTKHYYVK